MNLTSIETIKKISQKYNFWPSRKSGQNFLINEDIIKKIISAADLDSQDLILEIGPGFGTLTFALAGKVKKVIAIELDKRLVKALRDLLNVQDAEGVENVEVVEGDIFKLRTMNQELRTLKDLNYKLVSNLPYNITSLVLRNFLENKPRPSEMILLVQKEVAERVVAQPGEMSLLSVACQFYGQPEIISEVSKENFWPQPEVDSALLKIMGLSHIALAMEGLLGDIEIKNFFNLVKIGFSARRKQLQNNLAAGLRISNGKVKRYLEETGLDSKVRAQDLSIENWIKLAKILRKNDLTGKV